jgi:hypothetical protein
MTRPSVSPKHKLALLFLVCVSVLGGALLFSHAARHNTLSQAPELLPAEHREELPPVW